MWKKNKTRIFGFLVALSTLFWFLSKQSFSIFTVISQTINQGNILLFGLLLIVAGIIIFKILGKKDAK